MKAELKLDDRAFFTLLAIACGIVSGAVLTANITTFIVLIIENPVGGIITGIVLLLVTVALFLISMNAESG